MRIKKGMSSQVRAGSGETPGCRASQNSAHNDKATLVPDIRHATTQRNYLKEKARCTEKASRRNKSATANHQIQQKRHM
jgi:hypothetical protein